MALDTSAASPPKNQAIDRSALRAIDCDLHHAFSDWTVLRPYIDPGLRHRVAGAGGRGLARHGFRSMADPFGSAPVPETGPPNVDPVFVQKVLEDRGIDRAILTGSVFSLGVQPNMDLAAAYARAINDWTLERWLLPNNFFKGSILIAQQDAGQAAKEIDRLGSNPAFVQVLMCSASEAPFGRRAFHPIFEACVRNGLPLALHIGGEGAGVSAPSTAVGHPNTYLEWYSALPQSYMAHLMSLVTEGVFEKYPELRIVLCEGGIGWVPHVTWRLEKNFKAVRAETPWLRFLPSEYIRRHFWFTSYPLEEFPGDGGLSKICKMMGADQRVLFSSNFPDWEYGDPFEMVASISENVRRRIMVENAIDLYGQRLLAPNS